MPFLTTALAIGGIASGIGGAALGAHAAGQAAQTQANSANYAAQLQAQEAQNALDFQKQVYGNTLNQQQPFLQAGQGAVTNLANLLGVLPQNGGTTQQGALPLAGGTGSPSVTQMPGQFGTGITSGTPGLAFNAGQGMPPNSLGGIAPAGAPGAVTTGGVPTVGPVNTNSLINPDLGARGSLMQGWNQQFTAPTNVTEANDPGYQFRLNQGMQALQNSAAARGGLLSGGTAKQLEQYGQDYASNEYGNVYNRALGEYQQNYNIFQQNQANQFNRLASLAGLGQVTAGQLSGAGQSAAGNVGNILLTAGGQMGQNINNAGAARASGYVGGANAWSGALGNIGSNIGQLMTLNQLLNNGGGGTPNYSAWGGDPSAWYS